MTEPELQSELKPVFRQCWPLWDFTNERVKKIWHRLGKYPVLAVIDATREHFFGSDRSYPLLGAIADRVARTSTRADVDEYDSLPARLQRAWSFRAAYGVRAKEIGSLSDIADALEATGRGYVDRRRRVRLADAKAAEVPLLCRSWWPERFRILADDVILERWQAWKMNDPMPEFNPEGPQQAPPEAVPF